MNEVRRTLKLIHNRLQQNPTFTDLTMFEKYVNNVIKHSDDKEATKKAEFLQGKINTLFEEMRSKISPIQALKCMYESLQYLGVTEIKGYSLQELFHAIEIKL